MPGFRWHVHPRGAGQGSYGLGGRACAREPRPRGGYGPRFFQLARLRKAPLITHITHAARWSTNASKGRPQQQAAAATASGGRTPTAGGAVGRVGCDYLNLHI